MQSERTLLVAMALVESFGLSCICVCCIVPQLLVFENRHQASLRSIYGDKFEDEFTNGYITWVSYRLCWLHYRIVNTLVVFR